MDIFELISLNFKGGLYKQRPDLIDAVSTKSRISQMIEKRRGTRHDAAFEKRKIPVDMSPATPLAKKLKRTVEVVKPVDTALKERQEKLVKYKAEKLRKKTEGKKNAKPRFLVTRVNVSVGLPDLENVNREIKGKKFTSKFAPLNHQFKPPANIKPLQFENSNNTVVAKRQQQQQPHQMMTRSRGPPVRMSPAKKPPKSGKEKIERPKTEKGNKENVERPKTGKTNKEKIERPKIVKENKEKIEQAPTKPNDGSEKKAKTPKKNNKTQPTKSTINKVKPLQEKTSNKLDNTVLSQIDNKQSEKEIKTPSKNETEPPVYISPFVTVSRGKQNARKEYEARRSGKSFFSEKIDTADCVSPKAGAKYFLWVLNKEISRLDDLCSQWNEYKTKTNASEETASMIDVAVGQARLFISKKCDQFRGLIFKCMENDLDTPVTCEDLHGFWDMMLIQVKNLNLRFVNLDNLKANNWEEIRPEIVKKAVKPKGRPRKNVTATSSLKAAIEAARKQKQADIARDAVFEAERASLKDNRLSLVQNSGKKRISSPGLTIMKIAQYAKNVSTPGKSILKTESARQTKSHNKSVIFFDDVEASIQSGGKKSNSTKKTPSRKSARLSRTKLF